MPYLKCLLNKMFNKEGIMVHVIWCGNNGMCYQRFALHIVAYSRMYRPAQHANELTDSSASWFWIVRFWTKSIMHMTFPDLSEAHSKTPDAACMHHAYRCTANEFRSVTKSFTKSSYEVVCNQRTGGGVLIGFGCGLLVRSLTVSLSTAGREKFLVQWQIWILLCHIW